MIDEKNKLKECLSNASKVLSRKNITTQSAIIEYLEKVIEYGDKPVLMDPEKYKEMEQLVSKFGKVFEEKNENNNEDSEFNETLNDFLKAINKY